MALQERHDLAPQLRGGLGSVGRAVVGEESVAGVVVDVDFDFVAAVGGALAQLLGERRRGVLVFGADRGEQRAFELLGEL